MELGPCIPGVSGNIRQGPCHEQDGNRPMSPQLHMLTLVSMYSFPPIVGALLGNEEHLTYSAFTRGSVQLLHSRQHLREPQLSTGAHDRGGSAPLECCAGSGTAHWTAQTIAGTTGTPSPLSGLYKGNGCEHNVLPWDELLQVHQWHSTHTGYRSRMIIGELPHLLLCARSPGLQQPGRSLQYTCKYA